MIRCCPSCLRRFGSIAEPDCIHCDGTGVLALGPAAVDRYGIEAASLAVEFALEARARLDLGQQHLNLDAARRNQRATIEKMRQLGVLARRPGDARLGARRMLSPAQIRLTAAQASVTGGHVPGDVVTLESGPIEWQPDDRPLAAGGIPGFSNAGFIAHLSRVADPQDALSMGGIREQSNHRTTTRRKARVIAESLPLFDI